MTEIFCNERLIDYFAIFDIKINGINTNIEVNDQNEYQNKINDSEIKILYEYNISKMYPKKIYKEKNMYELNFDSIFSMLPSESLYTKKPDNKYFCLIFTNCKHKEIIYRRW